MIYKTEQTLMAQIILIILTSKSITSEHNATTTANATTTSTTTEGYKDTNNSVTAEQVPVVTDGLNSLTGEQVPVVTDALNSLTGEQTNSRKGKDLVYESMKMRSGNWKPRSPDDQIMVGGGIVEKKLLRLNPLDTNYADEDIESREMQCCDEVTVESFGGILECHPYVLGEYRRIGQCGGRSFYQHKNNTDIFIYYVCGAWYVGLQVGVCGGWILAKSQEICATSRHKTPWQFFNEGQLYADETFRIVEKCQFNQDFPVFVSTSSPSKWVSSSDVSNYPNFVGSGVLDTVNSEQGQSQSLNYPSTATTLGGPGSIKHEHIHYHYEQEKPPPETSAKSNKLENLKRYQQQVFQNRLGVPHPIPASSSPSPAAYAGSNPSYGVVNPVYPAQLITKASLYGRPSKEGGYTAQYETEYVRSKPLFVARDQANLGFSSSSAQHFYRDDSSPEQLEELEHLVDKHFQSNEAQKTESYYFPVQGPENLQEESRLNLEGDVELGSKAADSLTKHNSRRMR